MWERPGLVSVMALVLLTMFMFSSEYTLNYGISERHSIIWKNTVLFGVSVNSNSRQYYKGGHRFGIYLLLIFLCLRVETHCRLCVGWPLRN